MKNPPFLIAAALLFWGWQSQFMIPAILMAVALEGARWIHWRWDFANTDFNRIADLSSLIFIGTAIWLFSTTSLAGIFILLQWQPLIFFPLVATQAYATKSSIPMGALFLSVRRLETNEGTDQAARIDLSWPYFALTLIATSAGNLRSPWFFYILAGLIAWSLWQFRPRRYHPLTWLVLITTATIGGYGTYHLIEHGQARVAEFLISLFDYHQTRSVDPYRISTAIGTIGTLKLSDEIVMRVKTPERRSEPLLLRESSYNDYHLGQWTATDMKFGFIEPEFNTSTWNLSPVTGAQHIEISAWAQQHQSLILALPDGTQQIKRLKAVDMERNNFGTTKVDHSPGFARYSPIYDADAVTDTPPSAVDLGVSRFYQRVITDVADQLQLKSGTQQQAVHAVKQFFANNFHYSLVQSNSGRLYRPLDKFLLENRKGHCEYFATATALLLREAGIPTRYAVGFSVNEYSELEGSYVVRNRHAHSWVIAWINNRWVNIDTTPSVWAPLEAEAANWWEPVADFISWVRYSFLRWKHEGRDNDAKTIWLWLLIPLALYLGWRLYRKERVLDVTTQMDEDELAQAEPGLDSDFYQVINHLQTLGVPRRAGESLGRWMARIRAGLGGTVVPRHLDETLGLHYQYRFDPAGMTAADHALLRKAVRNWIATDPK